MFSRHLFIVNLFGISSLGGGMRSTECRSGSNYVLFVLLCMQGRLYTNADFVIFGVITFIAGIVSLQLPETLNRPMVETAEEIDSMPIL